MGRIPNPTWADRMAEDCPHSRGWNKDECSVCINELFETAVLADRERVRVLTRENDMLRDRLRSLHGTIAAVMMDHPVPDDG